MDFFIRIMAGVSVGDYQLGSPDNRAEEGCFKPAARLFRDVPARGKFQRKFNVV